MATTSLSSAQLKRFRREAKKLSRELSITHTEALDHIAALRGFRNWSLLAKHSDAVPASPPKEVMTSTPRRAVKRYYLHGDVSEDDPTKCFCVRCDLRVPFSHFDGKGFHGDGEDCERYLASLAIHNEQPSYRKAERRRPDNAPNILAARAVEEREAFERSRSPFHHWLEGQRKRRSIIGDLAGDILSDKSFPVGLTTRAQIEAHLKWHGPHVVRAIRAAWKEFSAHQQETAA